MVWNWSSIREAIGYVRSFFDNPPVSNRKRRMIDSEDVWSNKRHKSASGITDIIDLEAMVLNEPISSVNVKRRSVFKPPLSRNTETIILDDDSDIITIKKGNEIRFQQIPSNARFTSTPQYETRKPYVNGTNGTEDDEVTLVKEIKPIKKTEENKLQSSYFKPFTGSLYLKSLQNGSNYKNSTKNTNSVSRRRLTKPVDSFNLSIRLDDKLQYQKLLERATSNDSSIYSTPVGNIFPYDTSNSSLRSRGRRMVNMALSPKNGNLSTKQTIEKVLNDFENDTVEIKDSDSESDIIFVNPPSPKPDIKVEPINSLKKITVDTSERTKPNWIDEKVENYRKYIQKRQEEIDALRTVSGKHGQINNELRMELLTDKVHKVLQFKEQILPEKEPEEELPELTTAQLKLVDKAFRGDSNEILARKFNLNVTRRDLQTLAGLNWLNDEVINFYMNMIIERSKNGNWPKSYAFNTFFYAKLTKDGPQSLRRWTKRVDLFEHDLICVPIHLGMHWCMAIIDFRDKSIRYYDSMGGNNNRCLEALRNYLEAEHLDKKKTPYDTSDFSLENVKDIPQQMNGSDCGMFSCTFAEFITRNAKITFSQEHMPYLRKKMVLEILQGELLIQ